MTILLSGYFERSSNAREDFGVVCRTPRPGVRTVIIAKNINEINDISGSLASRALMDAAAGSLPIKGSFSTIA
ncbi:hypothetical protein [Allomesorhizobium camelthorni]|uniref:Uncharacterized protein n=1 Tax=Allomesorhizobium camelthorni TaxID=475069 RepID=A0A6G4WEU6_9HYPH|nr:hypothetical protein [Mesorhizobium camelthorni]NGO52637.1 hypothetical protein [Mesorhizobium camelthorni]